MSNRNFMNIRSETNLKSESDNLKEVLIEKDRQISQLQSAINKLELKSKQFSTYQAMIEQSDNRIGQLQNQVMETKEKLRQKTAQAQTVKSKLKDLELKNKNQIKTRSSFIKKEDYDIVKKQLQAEKEKVKKISSQAIIVEYQDKLQIANLQIKRLQEENQEINKILNIKNQQLYAMKPQVQSNYQQQQQKEPSQSQTSNQMKELTSQIQRLNLQLQNITYQKQEYRNRSHTLQQKLQEYVHTSTQWSTHNKNIEYLNKISQYEDHIHSMASKLSAIHKIEMEKNEVEKQRREFRIQCESLREQNKSLKYYIEQLEEKIRKIQQYNENYLEVDMEKFLKSNKEIGLQLQQFFKKLGYREDQLAELKQKIIGITSLFNQQMIIQMQSTLNSLEHSLNQCRQKLHQEQEKTLKEQEKSMKLNKDLKSKQIEYNEIKSELSKMNRVISQKMQKIEFQAVEIKRLENQNKQKINLSEKCAKLQKSIVQMENKNDTLIDQNNDLLMTLLATGIQLDRINNQDKVSPELVKQIEQLNKKAIENQTNSKNIEDRINRLEHLHKCVVEESVKISEHLHMSHRRWNHYDHSMEQLKTFLEKIVENTDKTYQQIDKGIEQNIKRHEKIIEDIKKKDEEDLQQMIAIRKQSMHMNEQGEIEIEKQNL